MCWVASPNGAFAFVALSPAAQMKVKMEDMAQEFGDMLKETLDRMRERIEVIQTRTLCANLSFGAWRNTLRNYRVA